MPKRKIYSKLILIIITMMMTEKLSATYTMKTYPNDPLHTKIYTLQNGLTVYLSEFKDKPRIQTY